MTPCLARGTHRVQVPGGGIAGVRAAGVRPAWPRALRPNRLSFLPSFFRALT